jgi:hypothetical protein
MKSFKKYPWDLNVMEYVRTKFWHAFAVKNGISVTCVAAKVISIKYSIAVQTNISNPRGSNYTRTSTKCLQKLCRNVNTLTIVLTLLILYFHFLLRLFGNAGGNDWWNDLK